MYYIFKLDKYYCGQKVNNSYYINLNDLLIFTDEAIIISEVPTKEKALELIKTLNNEK